MAHLRLYKNTFPGRTDGTEITGLSGDFILGDGLFNSTAAAGATLLMLCLRCDPGYQVSNLTITTSDTNKASFVRPAGYNAGSLLGDGIMSGLTDWKSNYAFYNGFSGAICVLPSGSYIRQVNVGFYLVLWTPANEAAGSYQDVQLNFSFVEDVYTG